MLRICIWKIFSHVVYKYIGMVGRMKERRKRKREEKKKKKGEKGKIGETWKRVRSLKVGRRFHGRRYVAEAAGRDPFDLRFQDALETFTSQLESRSLKRTWVEIRKLVPTIESYRAALHSLLCQSKSFEVIERNT